MINRYLVNGNIASLDAPIFDEKQVRRFNGRLGQILRCHTFLFVSI